MAIIAQAAFNNSDVLEISSTKSYKLAPTQNNPSGATCANEHRLIITDDETSELYCPEAKAGKKQDTPPWPAIPSSPTERKTADG